MKNLLKCLLAIVYCGLSTIALMQFYHGVFAYVIPEGLAMDFVVVLAGAVTTVGGYYAYVHEEGNEHDKENC